MARVVKTIRINAPVQEVSSHCNIDDVLAAGDQVAGRGTIDGSNWRALAQEATWVTRRLSPDQTEPDLDPEGT